MTRLRAIGMNRHTSRTPLRMAVAAVVISLLAACTGSPAAAPLDTDPNDEGTKVIFDPANFVDPTLDTNPFHPLKPGMQWVRGGTTEVGSRVVPHEIITTMTDVIRVIDGVPTIAMLDESTDSSEVSQVGMDYLALDKDGNVWILGGYTEEFEGGLYTNAETAWLGTADASPGILSPGVVTMETLGGTSEPRLTRRPRSVSLSASASTSA